MMELNLDGTGTCQVASHGLLDLTISASGDTHINDHHTNEDVGIAEIHRGCRSGPASGLGVRAWSGRRAGYAEFA